MYYIGIDAGGQYARLAGVDPEWRVIGRHAGNPIHPKFAGADEIKENLRRLIYEFNRFTNTRLDDCLGVCIGGDGLRTEANYKQYTIQLQEIGAQCPVHLVSEGEMTIAAETKARQGIAVMSGHAAAAFGWDALGQFHQLGGYGAIIGEDGSGYTIGIQAVCAALKAQEGIAPRTTLTEKLTDYFQTKSIYGIMHRINKGHISRARITELSVLVKHEAKAGDAVSAEIEERAANCLFLLGRAIVLRCEMPSSCLITCGSLFSHHEGIRGRFTVRLQTEFIDLSIVPLKEKPEVGAAFLCRETGG